jgi:hypothetical protein
MAWSYRQDRTDELYSENVGVTLVKGEKLPDTPADPEDSKEMLEKPEQKKGQEDAVVTQVQEYPNQDVPRVIEGEGDTRKDKEIVEAVKGQRKLDEQAEKDAEKAEKQAEKDEKNETAAAKK